MMDQNIVRMAHKIHSKSKGLPETWLNGTDIKEDRYFSISEVSRLCKNIKPYVLRYWESQFKNFSPVRKNARRYYRRCDIIIARNIYNLVHIRRYTIEGAINHFADLDAKKNIEDSTKSNHHHISWILADLKNIENILK